MNVNSSVTRSVGVSLNPQEQYVHEGPVRFRDTVRKARIRTVSAVVRDNGSIGFTLEGPTINKDGDQGAVYRRFEMSNLQASVDLPEHIYDAILAAFNEQGCPPLRNLRTAPAPGADEQRAAARKAADEANPYEVRPA